MWTLLLSLFGMVFWQVVRFQGALAEIGRTMSEAENNAQKPIEYQNSITPPWLIKMWMVIAAATLGALIYVVYEEGIVSGVSALAGFIGGALVSGAISNALSRPRFETYAECALNVLINREADYRRDGDTMRADAAKHFVSLMGVITGKKIS